MCRFIKDSFVKLKEDGCKTQIYELIELTHWICSKFIFRRATEYFFSSIINKWNIKTVISARLQVSSFPHWDLIQLISLDYLSSLWSAFFRNSQCVVTTGVYFNLQARRVAVCDIVRTCKMFVSKNQSVTLFISESFFILMLTVINIMVKMKIHFL